MVGWVDLLDLGEAQGAKWLDPVSLGWSAGDLGFAVVLQYFLSTGQSKTRRKQVVDTPDVRAALERVHAGESAQSLEGQNLDFKEDSSSFNDTAKLMAEAAACFTNASGGTLVLGVRDRPGGPTAIVGTSANSTDCRNTP